MRGKANLLTWLMFAVFLLLTAYTTVLAQDITDDTNDEYEAITVFAKPLKDSYAISQHVPLELVITNHSSESVYTTVDEKGYLMTNVKVEDANGVVYPLSVPDPPHLPPRNWWVEVDGEQIFVVPVIKIEPNQTKIAVIQDALVNCHNQLHAGTYDLRPSDIEIIHEVGFIISRENLSPSLWINPGTILTRSRHNVNKLEINLVQKIIYVDDDATGANDGSSWENAYTYLQDALANANSAQKPVEIRVAQGIYKPDQGEHQKWGNQRAIFRLINDVDIMGGYAGVSESDPNHRDIDLYETVLSGDLNDDDVDINDPRDLRSEPTRSDNSSNVLSGSNTDETAILDGFTITGGRHTFVGIDTTHGGAGMINYSGSPTLMNCTFTCNTASQSGGGLLNLDNSNPTLISCTFSRNYGGMSGGGMCNSIASWHSSRESNPTLINCIFHKNVSNGSGAAMSNYNGSIKLTNCTFSENSARRDGGGISNGSSNPVLNNCVFINNQAEDFGGGMNNNSGSPELTNCYFIGNYAQETGGGMAGSNSTLLDCIFIENISNRHGGGLAGNNSIYNCFMIGNSAVNNGGAIYGLGEVINCTIIGNKAGENGGGIYTSGITNIVNSILFRNRALIGDQTYLGSHIIPPGRSGTVIITPSALTIDYSNVQGGEEQVLLDTDCTLVWKPNNIDVDPLFANPGYWANENDPNIIVEPNDLPQGIPDGTNAVWIDGDYHLKSQAGRYDPNSDSWVIDDVTSPCIDAGDPNSSIGDEPEPNGGRINMGAYGGTEQASKSYAEE
jgi:predicted outer membrane repeat protein